MARRRPIAKRRILEFLDGRPPQILKDIAAGIEIAPSAVHRHLQELTDDGILHREDAHSPKYSLAPFFHVRWNDFLHGGHHEWMLHDDVDWRYPLTSRIEDDSARTSVLSFLRECEKAGLWTPWIMYQYMDWDDNVAQHIRDTSADPDHYRDGVTAAWCQDHLLILTPADTPENRPLFPYRAAMEGLAAQAGLPIRIMRWDQWDKCSGTTVFTTADPPRFIESA